MKSLHANSEPSNGMKLADIKKAHFIGIGGIGMSGLARLFVHEGKEVSGTNDSESPQTLDALRSDGVPISLDTSALPEADVYIFSEAWRTLNPVFLQKAFDSGIPTINYFDALGMVANEYYLIAVAGSHGKTTTTAMLIDVFEEAGLDPSAIVGSLRSKTKSNYRAGKSKYFIAEACEYRRDFLALEPDVLVITNIEHEHVDYYKDLEAVQKAFRELAEKVPEDGFVVANLSDPKVCQTILGPTSGAPEVGPRIKAQIIDYSKYVNPLRKLTMPGMHNQMNAAAVVAVATHLGVKPLNVDEALSKFGGTWRRFEYKGEVSGAKVYDDYGHHPTEIKATMQGARELYPDREITIVFQSHTYTRTHELFNDFVDVLSEADRVIVLPIYFAREENESGVSHTKLADAIKEKNKNVRALDTVEEAVTELKKSLSVKDVVITMGAGDMTSIVAKGLISN